MIALPGSVVTVREPGRAPLKQLVDAGELSGMHPEDAERFVLSVEYLVSLHGIAGALAYLEGVEWRCRERAVEYHAKGWHGHALGYEGGAAFVARKCRYLVERYA